MTGNDRDRLEADRGASGQLDDDHAEGELQQSVRTLLLLRAASLTPPGDPFPAVLQRATRLRRRRQVLAATSAALVVGGVVFSAPWTRSDRDGASLAPAAPAASAAAPGSIGAASPNPEPPRASANAAVTPSRRSAATLRTAAGWAFRGDARIAAAQRPAVAADPGAAGATITPLYAAPDQTGGYALYLVRPATGPAHFTLVQAGRLTGTEPGGPDDAPFLGLVRGEAAAVYLVVADPATTAATFSEGCGTRVLTAQPGAAGVYAPSSLTCPRPPIADSVTVTVPGPSGGQLSLSRAYRDYRDLGRPSAQTG